MTSMSLPKELNYADILCSIGEATNTSHYLLPINGQSFSTANAGNTIQFDLPASQFLDPSSLYIKYKYQITSTGFSDIWRIPVYVKFSRLFAMQCRMYYVKTAQGFPFRGAGWYTQPLIEYALNMSLIVFEDITLDIK